MASNFSMRFQRSKGNLCIMLKGDLDKASVGVLFDALKRDWADEREILVDTDGLRRVYTSGRDAFRNRFLGLKSKRTKVIFTGKNWAKLAPEEI